MVVGGLYGLGMVNNWVGNNWVGCNSFGGLGKVEGKLVEVEFVGVGVHIFGCSTGCMGRCG